MAGESKPNIKSLDEVIYPEIEPAVINKDMIEDCYLNDDYQGEELRLHKMEPVVFDRIQSIKLEFKNILRIDHLWILPNLTKLSLNRNKIEKIEHIDMLVNLTELDLSFNFIEKIENLHKLVKLEVLTLFHNLIPRIENMDALTNLMILSLGQNNIKTVDGIERFRFLDKLQVLNMEGNPVTEDPEFPFALYIAAVLPNIKYYCYEAIKDEDREMAQERFVREIREIETNEEKETDERNRIAKEERDAARLASSFVEHLNEHQLFESLWKNDEDGRILMLVGQGAQDLCDEYKSDMYDITQEIYKLGLNRCEERENEVEEFMSCLEEGQNEIQNFGQKAIEEFLKVKEKIFEEATIILRDLESRTMHGEDEESPESLLLLESFDQISQGFDEEINSVWQKLMSQELHLHEAVEESTINFQRKMQEIVAKFIEQEQTYFGQLRDIALHFTENLTDIVIQYITYRLATQDFSEVPPDFMHCIEDRDYVMNLLSGMKDTHVQKIDEREDRLITRCRDYVENMIDRLNNEELERNRNKILEINAFLEMTAESLNQLQLDIREEVLEEDN